MSPIEEYDLASIARLIDSALLDFLPGTSTASVPSSLAELVAVLKDDTTNPKEAAAALHGLCRKGICSREVEAPQARAVVRALRAEDCDPLTTAGATRLALLLQESDASYLLSDEPWLSFLVSAATETVAASWGPDDAATACGALAAAAVLVEVARPQGEPFMRGAERTYTELLSPGRPASLLSLTVVGAAPAGSDEAAVRRALSQRCRTLLEYLTSEPERCVTLLKEGALITLLGALHLEPTAADLGRSLLAISETPEFVEALGLLSHAQLGMLAVLAERDTKELAAGKNSFAPALSTILNALRYGMPQHLLDLFASLGTVPLLHSVFEGDVIPVRWRLDAADALCRLLPPDDGKNTAGLPPAMLHTAARRPSIEALVGLSLPSNATRSRPSLEETRRLQPVQEALRYRLMRLLARVAPVAPSSDLTTWTEEQSCLHGFLLDSLTGPSREACGWAIEVLASFCSRLLPEAARSFLHRARGTGRSLLDAVQDLMKSRAKDTQARATVIAFFVYSTAPKEELRLLAASPLRGIDRSFWTPLDVGKRALAEAAVAAAALAADSPAPTEPKQLLAACRVATAGIAAGIALGGNTRINTAAQGWIEQALELLSMKLQTAGEGGDNSSVDRSVNLALEVGLLLADLVDDLVKLSEGEEKSKGSQELGGLVRAARMLENAALHTEAFVDLDDEVDKKEQPRLAALAIAAGHAPARERGRFLVRVFLRVFSEELGASGEPAADGDLQPVPVIDECAAAQLDAALSPDSRRADPVTAVALGGKRLRHWVADLLRGPSNAPGSFEGLRAALVFLELGQPGGPDLTTRAQLAVAVVQRLSANGGFSLRAHGETVRALLHFAAHFLGALATGPTWHVVSSELAQHEAVVARDTLVACCAELHIAVLEMLVPPDLRLARANLLDLLMYVFAILQAVGPPTPGEQTGRVHELFMQLWTLAVTGLDEVLSRPDTVQGLCHEIDSANLFADVRQPLSISSPVLPIFARKTVRASPPLLGADVLKLDDAFDLHESPLCPPGRVLLTALARLAPIVLQPLKALVRPDAEPPLMQGFAKVLAAGARISTASANPDLIIQSACEVQALIMLASTVITCPRHSACISWEKQREDAASLLVSLLRRPPLEALLTPRSTSEVLAEVPGSLAALRWCAGSEDSVVGVGARSLIQVLGFSMEETEVTPVINPLPIQTAARPEVDEEVTRTHLQLEINSTSVGSDPVVRKPGRVAVVPSGSSAAPAFTSANDHSQRQINEAKRRARCSRTTISHSLNVEPSGYPAQAAALDATPALEEVVSPPEPESEPVETADDSSFSFAGIPGFTCLETNAGSASTSSQTAHCADDTTQMAMSSWDNGFEIKDLRNEVSALDDELLALEAELAGMEDDECQGLLDSEQEIDISRAASAMLQELSSPDNTGLDGALSIELQLGGMRSSHGDPTAHIESSESSKGNGSREVQFSVMEVQTEAEEAIPGLPLEARMWLSQVLAPSEDSEFADVRDSVLALLGLSVARGADVAVFVAAAMDEIRQIPGEPSIPSEWAERSFAFLHDQAPAWVGDAGDADEKLVGDVGDSCDEAFEEHAAKFDQCDKEVSGEMEAKSSHVGETSSWCFDELSATNFYEMD